MIHSYKLNGYNIVLDVCSGSVHVVDEAAYDLIGLYENTPREAAIDQVAEKYPELDREELEACYEDITALKDAGVDARWEQEDRGDSITLTISIPKSRSRAAG